MATTSRTGIPVPTLGDTPNVPADMLLMAQYLDSRTIGKFASDAARTTAFSGYTIPTGTISYVTGLGFQMWSGSTWTNILLPAPEWQVSKIGNTATVDTVWKAVLFDTNDYTNPGLDLGGTSNGTGIMIKTTGRYYVEGDFSIQAQATVVGRRLISLGPASIGGNISTGVPGTAQTSPTGRFFATPAYANSAVDCQISRTMQFNSGDVAGLWVYQASGTALTVANARLVVRRVA